MIVNAGGSVPALTTASVSLELPLPPQAAAAPAPAPAARSPFEGALHDAQALLRSAHQASLDTLDAELRHMRAENTRLRAQLAEAAPRAARTSSGLLGTTGASHGVKSLGAAGSVDGPAVTAAAAHVDTHVKASPASAGIASKPSAATSLGCGPRLSRAGAAGGAVQPHQPNVDEHAVAAAAMSKQGPPAAAADAHEVEAAAVPAHGGTNPQGIDLGAGVYVDRPSPALSSTLPQPVLAADGSVSLSGGGKAATGPAAPVVDASVLVAPPAPDVGLVNSVAGQRLGDALNTRATPGVPPKLSQDLEDVDPPGIRPVTAGPTGSLGAHFRNAKGGMTLPPGRLAEELPDGTGPSTLPPSPAEPSQATPQAKEVSAATSPAVDPGVVTIGGSESIASPSAGPTSPRVTSPAAATAAAASSVGLTLLQDEMLQNLQQGGSSSSSAALPEAQGQDGLNSARVRNKGSASLPAVSGAPDLAPSGADARMHVKRALEGVLALHGWQHLEVEHLAPEFQRNPSGDLWRIAGATFLLRCGQGAAESSALNKDGGASWEEFKLLASQDGGETWDTIEEAIRKKRLQKVVRTVPIVTGTLEYEPDSPQRLAGSTHPASAPSFASDNPDSGPRGTAGRGESSLAPPTGGSRQAMSLADLANMPVAMKEMPFPEVRSMPAQASVPEPGFSQAFHRNDGLPSFSSALPEQRPSTGMLPGARSMPPSNNSSNGRYYSQYRAASTWR